MKKVDKCFIDQEGVKIPWTALEEMKRVMKEKAISVKNQTKKDMYFGKALAYEGLLSYKDELPEDKKELDALLPNKKWQVNFDKAAGHDISCLRLLDIDSNNTLLEVDLNKIPRGKTVVEFIEWLQESGIAYIDSFKESMTTEESKTIKEE